MRRMASPAALSRTLSLQRANARAKSSRPDQSFADQKSGNSTRQLSKRIDILFASISSTSSNTVTDSCNIDTHSKPVSEPSKQLAALQVNDGNHNAIKRSLSADLPSGYKACFSSLSERIDRGVDLWDRDFSSMSSYASDHDGLLCGLLQTRLNSDSNIPCEPAKCKEDACSQSSWSDDSFGDAIQTEDGASCSHAYRLQDLGIGCTSGRSQSYVANRNSRRRLQASDKHTLLLPEYGADNEGAKKTVRNAGNLEEYLISRGGYVAQVGASGAHSLQDVYARNGGGKVPTSEGNCRTTDHRSSKAEEHNEEGGGKMIGSKKEDESLYCNRMRERRKRDDDELEEEEIASRKRGTDKVEEGSDRERNMKEEEKWAEMRGVGLPAESVAVELVSVNVEEDFRESMYEMMMEEEEWEDHSMQDLLNCYLLLNPSHLHALIREVFSDVWIDIIMTFR